MPEQIGNWWCVHDQGVGWGQGIERAAWVVMDW